MLKDKKTNKLKKIMSTHANLLYLWHDSFDQKIKNLKNLEI
jgi:hypothetical protein